MPSNYTIQGYASMIHDARRVDAYRRALQQVVTPESVVVDIGTGLGIFAMLACQAGARKVYAIEPSSAITLASAMAAANGYSERIEFIQGVSSRVTLPEPADVIVSDLGGAIPLFQQHIPSIADARTRLLKPGGTLIPRCDRLWGAVVEAAECYATIAPPTDGAWGLDMRLAWSMAANLCTTLSPAKVRVLSAPERLAILDYTRVEDANLRTRIEWNVMHRGRGHGICVWFERTLADGICYSTAPGEPEMVYSPLFFPWLEPVELNQGDRVALDFRADLHDADYMFSWNTTVANAGRVRHTFRQSQFLGESRSPAELRKQSATHVPKLNGDGEQNYLLLQMMDGKSTNRDIACELQRQHPERFPTLERALGYVGEFSRKYSV